MGNEFIFNIPFESAKGPDTSVKAQMLKVSNDLSKIRSTRQHIKDTCFSFPFADIYIVIAAYSDNTYDLVKNAGDQYEFSFSSLGTQVASNLFKIEGRASGEQVSLERVPAIRGNKHLNQGDSVQVGFYDSSRQKPYIRRIVKRGKVVIDPGTPPSIALGLWSQPEANVGLSYFAPSDIVNPDGTSEVIFGGGALLGSPFFGLTVDKDGRLTFAQMLRDDGDTFWEKMRLYLADIDNSVTLMECTISDSPTFSITGDTFINGDRSFVLVINPGFGQLFRKHGVLFEQITLLDFEDLSLNKASVSHLGHLAIPNYGRHGVDTFIAASPSYNSPVYTEVTVDYTHRVNAWKTKTFILPQPKAWSAELGSSLELTKKRVFSNLGRDRMPISKDGLTMVAWVSGAKLMEEDHQIMGGYHYFNSYPDTFTHRTDISRELKACVVGLSSELGAAIWKHEIVVTAAQAIQDSGILSPIEAHFVTKTGLGLGVDNPLATYGGRASNLGHNSNGFRPFSSLDGVGGNYPYPDFAYFTNAAIVALPRPQDNFGDGANNTVARYVLGAKDTLAVFGDYIKANITTYDISQSPKIVADEEGNYYFAYLTPISYATPGTVGGLGTTRFNSWRGLLENTYDVREPDELGDFYQNLYHTPGMINCYRRWIRKISSVGATLSTIEVPQEYNSSWYELKHLIDFQVDPGVDVLGGDSSETWPLADQLWGLYPCGRVLFTILDYHDLGPTFGPACKLEIRSSTDLNILHTIELRSDDEVTVSDIYGRVEDEGVGAGDGFTTSFNLSQQASSLFSVKLDGIVFTTGFSLVGDNNIINFDTPPDDGVVVQVTYGDTTVKYYAGSRRYQVEGRSVSIRTGRRDTGWSEWALLWVNEIDITTAIGTGRRILILMDETDETIDPTITNPTTNPPSDTTIVSGGLLLSPSNIGIGIITATG